MRILVVEDEIKIARAIKQGLEQEGFAVDMVHTGTQGYDYALTEDYDAILLDIMIPEMNGVEVCENLRKENIKTPILMLTAKSTIENKIEGLNCGADDYLTKPFDFAELIARIRALLRRPKNLVSNTLKCGNLELDTQTFEVMRNKTPIQLSKKEFGLLEYLMRNKNTVISKDKIIEHVWNFDADILPNTVEVYIGYLRNKIDKNFKNDEKLIKTVRGFGYKINCQKDKNV